jgi:hypothetical protein
VRAATGTRSRFENLTGVSELAELIGDGHPGEARADDRDLDAFAVAAQRERRGLGRFEQPKTGHAFIGQRRAADGGETFDEKATGQHTDESFWRRDFHGSRTTDWRTSRGG